MEHDPMFRVLRTLRVLCRELDRLDPNDAEMIAEVIGLRAVALEELVADLEAARA